MYSKMDTVTKNVTTKHVFLMAEIVKLVEPNFNVILIMMFTAQLIMLMVNVMKDATMQPVDGTDWIVYQIAKKERKLRIRSSLEVFMSFLQ